MTGTVKDLVFSKLCALCSYGENYQFDTLMVPWPDQSMMLHEQKNICFPCARRINILCENCEQRKEVHVELLSEIQNGFLSTVPDRFCNQCQLLTWKSCSTCRSDTLSIDTSGSTVLMKAPFSIHGESLYDAPNDQIWCGYCVLAHICKKCQAIKKDVEMCQGVLHLICTTCHENSGCSACEPSLKL